VKSQLRVIFIRAALTLLALAFAAGAGWGAWRWWTYPKAPNVKTASLEDCLHFMSTNEFNRMFESDRTRFALATMEKMRERSFGQLLVLIAKPDPDFPNRARNLRQMEERGEVVAAAVRVFLDKFFDEPPAKQKVYLASFALLQQGEIAQHPERFGLPPPDRFKQDFGGFLAHQPPRVQGQMGQFLRDLKQTRQSMGLKEPF
jgi:hypothetical protein